MADFGYSGKNFASEVHKIIIGSKVEIAKRNDAHKFSVVPKRWIVERTFAWLNNSRILSKDYEFSVSSSKSMVIISHLHTL